MTPTRRMRSRWPFVAILCLLASLPVPGIASGSTASSAEIRVGAFGFAEQVGAGVERSLTHELHQGCAPTYGELVSYSPLVPRGTARSIVDPSGQTRIFLRNGSLEVSEHAAQRITQRGLTLDAVEGVVTNQQPFQCFHNGVWKTGYYDSASRVFVGSVDDTVTTVINNATPKYIQNLQAAQP